MNAILVLTTANSPELAQGIATSLVEAGHAACVSIVPGIRSIYRWEGKTCDEGELLLIIKTTTEHFEAARAHIRRLHSYELPEVVAVPVTAGDPEYLRWFADQLS